MKMNESYTELNAKAIDQWIDGGWEWGVPISHEAYAEALSGTLKIVLTPQRFVPHMWFSPFLQNNRLDGVRILGLASGGGQQMPVFAALGADCTVLDYSDRQLASERFVAEREGYAINAVKADMTKRLPFEDATFDIIFHPVSNCYVADVFHVWRECFRVLKGGGVLLAGMDNGFSFLFDDVSNDPANTLTLKNKLPYNPLKDPALYEQSLALDGSIQFSHTMEEQVGGQLQAGLVLTNLYEDRDTGGVLSEYYPQYIATRAVKPIA